MKHVVLDTNCLLVAISRRNPEYIVWEEFQRGHYTLCVTNEILSEYEEMIAKFTTPEIAQSVIMLLVNSRNVKYVETYFKFDLIKSDPDDNKFVDCAIAANATYIVSNDKHFDELDAIPFPQVNHIKLDTFIKSLKRLAKKKN